MHWALILLLMVGGLMTLATIRVPFAFALLVVNGVGVALVYGVGVGLEQLVYSMDNAVRSFVLVPLAMFVLMGAILVETGVAGRAMDALTKALTGLPGGLCTIGNISGAVFGAVSGSSLASTAVLGRSFLPSMRERQYSPRLSVGSLLSSGGLAMIIPPSALAVILGATARIPIGPLLIAGLIPGILMAINYLVVIAIWARCGGIPKIESEKLGALSRVGLVVRQVFPLGFVVMSVVGTILLGIATPTESGALGAVAALLLAAAYRDLTWQNVYTAFRTTALTTGMIMLLIGASGSFSQVMAATGASFGFVDWMLGLSGEPLVVLGLIVLVVLLLGTMLESTAIILLTVPLFMPVVTAFAWDPLWFGIIFLIALQMGLTTPPFGVSLFVMKGLFPGQFSFKDMYLGVLPFLLGDAVTICLLVAFPVLVTWLPGISGA